MLVVWLRGLLLEVGVARMVVGASLVLPPLPILLRMLLADLVLVLARAVVMVSVVLPPFPDPLIRPMASVVKPPSL